MPPQGMRRIDLGPGGTVDLLLTNAATTGEPYEPRWIEQQFDLSPVPSRESTAISASAAVKVYSFLRGGHMPVSISPAVDSGFPSTDPPPAAATPRAVCGEGVLLSSKVVAERLGISTRTLWRHCGMGKLPCPEVRIGRRTLWSCGTVTAWINAAILKGVSREA
jgi:predicted DNA-binding transcriptional regulator AlpA